MNVRPLAARAKRPALIIAFNFALLALLGALAAAAFEVILRYQEPRRPEGQASLARAPIVGWDSVPPVEVIEEGSSEATILFLGDSFTQKARWTRLTLARLRAQGLTANGYSLGVAGYGTIQSLVKLQMHVDRYNPTAVVLLFFAWNDIRDNFDSPAIYYNQDTRTRPYYEEGNGTRRLVRTGEPRREWWRSSRVAERFVLGAEAFAAKHRLARRGPSWFTEHSHRLLVGYSAPSLWDPFYRPAQADTPYVRSAWRATEWALADLNAFLAERGVRFVLLGIDNAFTVDEDVFTRWVPHPEGFDRELPLRRLGEIATRLGIRYVDCLPALRDLSRHNRRKVYNGPGPNLSGHLEPEGEEVVAALAAQALTSKAN